MFLHGTVQEVRVLCLHQFWAVFPNTCVEIFLPLRPAYTGTGGVVRHKCNLPIWYGLPGRLCSIPLERSLQLGFARVFNAVCG